MPHIVIDANGVETTYTDEEWLALGAADIAEANRAGVRTKRNALLAQTDFYALSDVTMSAEMATYRQALRDITSQDGFPDNITWPTKPE